MEDDGTWLIHSYPNTPVDPFGTCAEDDPDSCLRFPKKKDMEVNDDLIQNREILFPVKYINAFKKVQHAACFSINILLHGLLLSLLIFLLFQNIISTINCDTKNITPLFLFLCFR